MQEEKRKQLLEYEKKNAAVFQVMGSLKLLNIKVKSFVGRLEYVNEEDPRKMQDLNKAFSSLRKDIQFFLEEFKCFHNFDIHISSVDAFSVNATLLFSDQERSYTLVEMRRISVYLYRVADIMLKELRLWKVENDQHIHNLQLLNGKYYFNRK